MAQREELASTGNLDRDTGTDCEPDVQQLLAGRQSRCFIQPAGPADRAIRGWKCRLTYRAGVGSVLRLQAFGLDDRRGIRIPLPRGVRQANHAGTEPIVCLRVPKL